MTRLFVLIFVGVIFPNAGKVAPFLLAKKGKKGVDHNFNLQVYQYQEMLLAMSGLS